MVRSIEQCNKVNGCLDGALIATAVLYFLAVHSDTNTTRNIEVTVHWLILHPHPHLPCVVCEKDFMVDSGLSEDKHAQRSQIETYLK